MSGLGLGWHTIPDKLEDLKCMNYFYAARDCIGPVSIFRTLYRNGKVSNCEEENFMLWKCAYISMKKGDKENADRLLKEFKQEHDSRWPKAGPNPLFPPRDPSQIPPYFQPPPPHTQTDKN